MNFESIGLDKLNWSESELSPQKRKELKKILIDLIQEGHDLIRRSEEKLKKDKQILNIPSTSDSSIVNKPIEIKELAPTHPNEMVFIKIEPPDDLEEDMLVDYLDSFNPTELPNNKTLEDIFSIETNDSSLSDNDHEKEREIDEILSKIDKRKLFTCHICKKSKFWKIKELNKHIYLKYTHSIKNFSAKNVQ